MTWPRFGITNVFVLLSFSCHADSSVSPSCPSRTSDTRYLMISEIQCPLAFPMSPAGGLSSVESECKDTTFFQTTKIFFALFFQGTRVHVVIQLVGKEKKIQNHPDFDDFRHAFLFLFRLFCQNWACPAARFALFLHILLYIYDLRYFYRIFTSISTIFVSIQQSICMI